MTVRVFPAENPHRCALTNAGYFPIGSTARCEICGKRYISNSFHDWIDLERYLSLLDKYGEEKILPETSWRLFPVSVG